MTDKRIGSNFDVFLKEEGIKIPIHSEWLLNPLEAYDQLKKELAHKEQECEKWQNTANVLRKKLLNSTIKRKNLKVENDDLKKQRQTITNQYLIEYYKMFDKMILSKMSLEKLKNLAELVNEVIEEKLKEG